MVRRVFRRDIADSLSDSLDALRECHTSACHAKHKNTAHYQADFLLFHEESEPNPLQNECHHHPYQTGTRPHQDDEDNQN